MTLGQGKNDCGWSFTVGLRPSPRGRVTGAGEEGVLHCIGFMPQPRRDAPGQ